jgi:hypothetical protein
MVTVGALVRRAHGCVATTITTATSTDLAVPGARKADRGRTTHRRILIQGSANPADDHLVWADRTECVPSGVATMGKIHNRVRVEREMMNEGKRSNKKWWIVLMQITTES